jgi:hypothetical protein
MRLGVVLAIGSGVTFVVVFFAVLVARAQRRRSDWASLSMREESAPPAAPEHRDPGPGASLRTATLAPRLTSRAP